MATLNQVLQIEPSELVFRGPLDESVTVKLKLTNSSEDVVCYKVMVTAPQVYTVRPNKGTIPPNQSADLSVVLQPFKYEENQTYKHKLMVRSMLAVGETFDHCIDKMWQKVSPNEVMSTKLNCVIIPSTTMDTLKFATSSMQQEVSRQSPTGCVQPIHTPVLVAGIDIGNTYTRYAFSFRAQYNIDPLDIWMLSDLCSTEHSTKNPTVILLDEDRQFNSFGYDAVDKYMEHSQGHLFREIKQSLYYEQTDINTPVHINDVLGRQTPVVEVFREIIKRIKDHMFAEHETKCTKVQPEDIHWVITVPAVFTDKAVTMIKTAAIQSGIAGNKLFIAVEPVAALEYCKNTYTYRQHYCTIHRSDGLTAPEVDMFANGRQYMILDIGGETLDATVLRKDPKGNVTEQNKLCILGGGGKNIHKALDNVLSDIVGNEVYHRFRTEEYCRYGYRSLHKEFDERLKYEATDSNKKLTVTLPELITLESKYRFETALGMSPYAGEISVTRDKLRLSPPFWKGLVAEYCLTVVKKLKDVIASYCDKNACLVFVGGYSEFKTVQEALIEEFRNFDIFIPCEPGFATVCGSVLLGHISPLTIHRAPINSDTIVTIEDEQSKASDYELDNQSLASDFVQSVGEMSLSSDFIGDETISRTSKIQTELKCLSQRIKGRAQEISVRRSDIIDDVITAYKDIDVSRPLKTCFVGGDDIDMTKEMFGLFWEKVCSVWFRGENAVVPLVPVAKRAEARRVFPILGKILEHTLCMLGHFPPQICRSLMLAVAHPDQDVDADLVLDDYLLFVPEREGTLLSQSLKQPDWSENRKKRLDRFFSVNKISIQPTPNSFREDLLNIAYSEIIDSSHIYVALMRRGISDFALKHFFDGLDTDKVRTEYEMNQPTTERVAQIIEDIFDTADLSREEKTIINYLSNIVRDMSKKQLRQFLIWLTGSPCMPRKINITFRSSGGTSRLPLAHTGGHALELSREYSSYQDFERVLMDVLLNEFLRAHESDR